MKTTHLPSLIILFAALALLFPQNAQALAVPPAEMFQLPWEQGYSWIAMDGLDNGTRRLPSSPHNYLLGGAVDFAPHIGMRIGEDTSNAWVTAAASGTVFETSSCHIKISHSGGWTSEYYHLGNIQVKVGSAVSQNQRLAIIDNNEKGQVCLGNRWPGPHLHFVLRPNMRGATLAGWMVNYDLKSNITTFTKNGQTLGLFQPILNSMADVITPTPTALPSFTPTPVESATPTVSPAPTFVPTSEGLLTPTPLQTEVASLTPVFTPTDVNFPTPIFTPTDAVFSTPTFIPTDINFPTLTFTPPTDIVPFTPTATPVPTNISGLYAMVSSNPASIFTGDISQITVSLNNIPADGLASVEFTCRYNAAMLEVSNMAVTDLFGADAVMIMNTPQNGIFILAIAGSNGRRATAGGVALTFNAKGLQTGQSVIDCQARVSSGSGFLMDVPSVPATILTNPPVSLTGTVMGSVLASKPVTVRLYRADNSIAAETLVNANSSFNISIPAGTYTIVATAEGFLNAQGNAVIINGSMTAMPAVSLLAGDLDGNHIVDQYDAMTIGMSYNTAFPSVADLDNNANINVLDLELLAANYRKSGALMW
jgi:murein DD-endopeptidase MepM/ murein hydrolase activator NlpD